MLCCKAVYGGRLWRPVLTLEFARLVQQSLGTSALFLSYVLVIYYRYRPYSRHMISFPRTSATPSSLKAPALKPEVATCKPAAADKEAAEASTLRKKKERRSS
jgi:hypothetical protein